MRPTLRRSCATCAKAKHRCDLQTPRCSRCTERDLSCAYANQPVSSDNTQSSKASTAAHKLRVLPTSTPDLLALSVTIGARLDPFDTYPPTSLPRWRVHGLIHHFLSKIAFEYYPLDINPNSNPFIVSWWPLAISDPALFNISLQTASLDDELHAQKGFAHSNILKRDAVSLIRRKIDDPSTAFQDATMDAVVTMAAIEHGKGNLHESKMHIDAVKRMVQVRGGIFQIKQTSPLTARMVPWVAMLVMCAPQFQTQDDFGYGDGIGPIPQWSSVRSLENRVSNLLCLDSLDLDPVVESVVAHLRVILRNDGPSDLDKKNMQLSTNDLHDLTCYVLHKLLILPSGTTVHSTVSECIRYAISIYMLLVHGPTYYSHATLLDKLIFQLRYHLRPLVDCANSNSPFFLWCLTVGMVSSAGRKEHEWFLAQATALLTLPELRNWRDIERKLHRVLWVDARCGLMFRHAWDQIIALNSDPTFDCGSDAAAESSPISYR